MVPQVLVSCLMVTLPSPGRFAFVKRAITAYCVQTHSPRELVIVLDQDPVEAKVAIMSHVATLGRDDIQIIESPRAVTLGALRNVSRAVLGVTSTASGMTMTCIIPNGSNANWPHSPRATRRSASRR